MNPAITGGFGITRGYDAVSNLTSLSYAGTSLVYGYNDRDDLTSLTADNGPPTAFAYDDARNRTDVNTPDNTNRHYVYDGSTTLTTCYMGRRTSVTESGTTTYYHYDGSTGLTTSGWNVVAETSSSGAMLATYAYDNSNQPISMTRGGQTYYYQTNAHGDVVGSLRSRPVPALPKRFGEGGYTDVRPHEACVEIRVKRPNNRVECRAWSAEVSIAYRLSALVVHVP